MQRKSLNLLIIAAVVLVFSSPAIPWTVETHKLLSQQAAEHSKTNTTNYLQRIGLKDLKQYLSLGNETRSIEDWIQQGAALEDAGNLGQQVSGNARFSNHFHNPLRDRWEAGLDDWAFGTPQTGLSSLLWAQNGATQAGFPEGDWSWQTIRQHYYRALTAPTAIERWGHFARTFRGLGHQIHLLQDAAQPDHVRNDAHAEDSIWKSHRFGMYFEAWAEERGKALIDHLAAHPIFPAVDLSVSSGFAPITQFIDTEQYTGSNPSASLAQGLAEYTNANFFSDDTLFAAETYPVGHRHYFPYPQQSSTNLQDYLDQNLLPQLTTAEDLAKDLSFWIAKTGDGETIDYFVKPGYLARAIYDGRSVTRLFQRLLYLDEKCHEAYAEKLIPRAVGYSAALIDYFFRGKLALEEATTGAGFVIVNHSDEDLLGTFTLYYDTTSDTRRALWSKSLNLGAKDSGTQRSTPIDFASPTDAKTPGEYMLVFQGSMGAEFGAVVGNIVHAQTTVFKPVGISLSGFYGGAAKVFEGTTTTLFPTSGMLAVRPPSGGGGFLFPENRALYSLLFDGKPLVQAIVTQDFFGFEALEYVEVGPVSSGEHSFTIRFESTTEDLIYMDRVFSMRVKISTPW